MKILMIITISLGLTILLLLLGVIVWALLHIASDIEETYIDYKNRK